MVGSFNNKICDSPCCLYQCQQLSSRTKVKKVYSSNSTPQYVFIVWCLFKQRHDFKGKCKGKVVTVLLAEHHAMKAHWGVEV
jgi:hypothetical protein